MKLFYIAYYNYYMIYSFMYLKPELPHLISWGTSYNILYLEHIRIIFMAVGIWHLASDPMQPTCVAWRVSYDLQACPVEYHFKKCNVP